MIALLAYCNCLCRLQSQGYKALIVGGWVRDKYLGRRASDIDISTNATPWEVSSQGLAGWHSPDNLSFGWCGWWWW